MPIFFHNLKFNLTLKQLEIKQINDFILLSKDKNISCSINVLKLYNSDSLVQFHACHADVRDPDCTILVLIVC